MSGTAILLLTELRGDVLAELDPYGNALTIDLRRRFDLINGFGAWVSTTSSLAEIDEKFAPFARQLSESIAGVGNLSIAPGGVVATGLSTRWQRGEPRAQFIRRSPR